VVALGFLLPNVLRGRERRDVELFQDSVSRALRVARGEDVVFRGALDAGPGDSEALADAVNRALRLARESAPEEERWAAIQTAEMEWAAWMRRVRCSHQMRFSP